MQAALYINGKVVTGSNHGDAYSKVAEEEKDYVTSGFFDPTTSKFISDDSEFYLKEIILIRHGQCNGQEYEDKITEEGRREAKTTATFLLNMNMQDYQMFSSPYYRCLETAEIFETSLKIKNQKNEMFAKQNQNETNQDFFKRIYSTLDFLPKKSLIISHFDFINKMLQITTSKCVEKIENCSISHISNGKSLIICKKV